jgi:hypothetical protein
MAFTRQNLGQTSSFTRDSAVLNTVVSPAFTTFRADANSTNYSLGNDWSIKIDTNLSELSFNYKNNAKLTLSQSGFTLSSVILPEQSDLPGSPSVGTMLNHDGELKIYL